MNSIRHLSYAAVAALAASLALSGCATPGDVDKPISNQGETKQFKELDRSGDNMVSRDEIPVDNQLLVGFDDYDLNDDGQISQYEFGEYVEGLPD